jgi:HSP20 family protein
MSAWPSLLLAPEVGDLTDDVRRLFHELERDGMSSAIVGQCTPPLDVIETDEAIEIVMDLPGVSMAAVRVMMKGEVVVIAGHKVPDGPNAEGDYHLVERGSGRFARAVRIVPPFDGAQAAASLSNGELRIVLPKIHDRRGQGRRLSVTDAPIGHRC